MNPLLHQLTQSFERTFAGPAEAVVVAPGRVNLVGEHIDYHGLPVLPATIDRVVALAFRRRDDRRVNLRNLEPRYPPVEFAVGTRIPAEGRGAWGDYSRAAAQALEAQAGPLRGIDGLVGSTLPPAAGLSSSSALVVAVALALLHDRPAPLDRLALAELLARGERYVGLQGGGMDQAVCLAARRGHAAHIAFRPRLRVTDVPFPSDWRLVVASSMSEAAKSGGARAAYNTRVAEGRTALDTVAGLLGRAGQLRDYVELLETTAMEDALAMGDRALEGAPQRRYRHILTEAGRVGHAVPALRAADLERFGELLSASHASLRDDCEVSTGELDRLVALALAGGAAGARLTGAGLGGCIVAVATKETTGRVEDALWRGYYGPRGVPEASRKDLVFSTVPSEAARILAVEG